MRRLLIELRAALRTPVWVGTIWLTMACLGLVCAHFLPCCAPQFFSPITMLLDLAALLTAFRLGTSVLVMLGDLRELRAPGRLPAVAGRAVGLVLLVIAVIPAVVLALLERSADPALAIMSSVLTGLLLARLPWRLVYGLIALATLGFFMAHYRVLGVSPALGHTAIPPWLTYGVEVLLVVWLWRPVLAGDSQTLASAARRAAAWRGWLQVRRA